MIGILFTSRLARSFNLSFSAFKPLFYRGVMVGSNEVLERVERRAVEAEEMVELLKQHIDCLQKAVDKQQTPSSQAQVESLRRENERLKEEAAKLKKELVYWEVRNGVKQVPLPKPLSAPVATPIATPVTTPSPAQNGEKKPEEKPKQEKKKAEKKAKAEKAPKEQAKKEENLNASRFNFRVGKITAIKKHPDADTLFVEEIDIGEETPRTICSGLVGNIPMEELQDALCVVMANLKPVKMRGILSQGMVMCAKGGDEWRIVNPPSGAVPGDRVVFDAYPGTPDAQLNPKKKVWETCAPDFTTNDEGIPTYKGDPFKIPDKGICTTPIKNGVVR